MSNAVVTHKTVNELTVINKIKAELSSQQHSPHIVESVATAVLNKKVTFIGENEYVIESK